METGRSVTLARNGLVCSPHYLSAQAGIQMLQTGGNAIDAAIAANVVLNVVYPHCCGTGGDLFMMIYHAGSDVLYGLNGSGRSPRAASIERYQAKGHRWMPLRGIDSVTVPGAVDGWQMAMDRFGRLGLARALAPAIAYAEQGFGVGPKLHAALQEVTNQPWCHPSWREVYAPEGAPQPGSVLRLPELGRSLRTIADKGRDAFYTGDIAQAFVALSEREGGCFTLDDLKDHHGDWVEPLHLPFGEHEIFEMPPNTQGITALQMLGLTDSLPLRSDFPDPDNIHVLVEAKKLAFADRSAYCTDPEHMRIAPQRLIDPGYLKGRRALIDPMRASVSVEPGRLDGDTIYLCAVDGEGNAVSLIQSNFMGVGSGLVVPGWGIELHNRGAQFSLDSRKANALAPRKRPMHTLIPSMAFRGSRPEIVFGTMGGDGQAQFHLQIYTNLLRHGLDIQQAIEAPRWLHGLARRGSPEILQLEARFPGHVAESLRAKGHAVEETLPWSAAMGYAQGIIIDRATGLLHGGSDPRADSLSIGW